MKRYLKCSTNKYNFRSGDRVTVYEGKVGYANYDTTFIDSYLNSHGVEVALVEGSFGKTKEVPYSCIIPSEKEYFYSLTIEDVLTPEFVAELNHKDDSMWCKKISYKRVDRDQSIENTVGSDADIICTNPGENPKYRVVIIDYISKHYNVDRDITDESGLTADDELIYDALDILKHADEVIVNFAGYQRTFRK